MAQVDTNGNNSRDDLRHIVLKTLGEKRKDSANIVTIGTPGTGKSSLINTLIASMTGIHREYCHSGMFYTGKQKTVYTQRISADHYKGDIRHHRAKFLPNFIDIAGLEDEQSDLTEEILRIVLYGHLPPGQSLSALQQYGKEFGLQSLKEVCKKQTGVPVDRIIFVASAVQQLPLNLINCVVNVSQPKSGSAEYRKSFALFGTMTMKDRILEEGPSTQNKITEFCHHLGIGRKRIALIQNYTDDDLLNEEKSIAELDMPALKFLKKVCDPVYDVQDVHEPIIAKSDTGMSTTHPLQNLRVMEDVFWLTIKAIILAVFVNLFVLPMIDFTLLNSACAKYEQQVIDASDFKTNATVISNDYLEKLCGQRSSYSAKSVTILWYGCGVGAVVDMIIILLRVACHYHYHK